jgi:hypothetical protein
MNITQALCGLGLYFLAAFGVGLFWIKREKKAKRDRPNFFEGGYGGSPYRESHDSHEEHMTSSIG